MRNLRRVALGENVRLSTNRTECYRTGRRAILFVILLTFIATQAQAVQASSVTNGQAVVDRPDLHAVTLQSGEDKAGSRHTSAFAPHGFFYHSSERFSVALLNGARRLARAQRGDVQLVRSGVWRSRAPPVAG